MARKLRTYLVGDENLIDDALFYLKAARTKLRAVGTPQSLRKVHSAIKSTEGALRHCRRLRNSAKETIR